MSDSGKSLLLSVNAGSSSLKISLYTLLFEKSPASHNNPASEPISLLLTSSISDISSPPAKFSFKFASTSSAHTNIKDEPVDSITDHASAFAHCLEVLKSEASIDRDRITHVCHRVVHGGDYTNPVVISQESYHHIESLSDLAPLHNGAALSVISSSISALPKATSIAYFDTAFHRSIPPYISSYAINQKIAKEKGLKKYGFHGLSYSFILRSVSKFLQKAPTTLNLIILHLGSGASVCAVHKGRSLDTSMGLTPVNGLPGATRSGSIDPSLIFHYTNKAGHMSHDKKMATDLHVTQAEEILNRQSGWKAITGTTDFELITKRADLSSSSSSSSSEYRLAFDIFTDRIFDYIGAYYLKLDAQVDALVFSGGIGERSKELREVVGKKVECLGFVAIDRCANGGVDGMEGAVVDIGGGGGGAGNQRILVCRTDEQREMASQCALEKKFWDIRADETRSF